MNWKIFDLKYDKMEQWAFEQMSYLLFCADFKNRIGLFRYKNQTGIETEPIEKDGIFYGFQAKYYTTSISKNKGDIINSIKKAKSKNEHISVIQLYINQELSESPRKDKKKPQYQIDIENAAQAIGIRIEWRVPSHFELQLQLPENKYIYDIFFNLEPNEGDLLDEVLKHNENIIGAIQTEILFNEKQIKIDRTSTIGLIENSLQRKLSIIISGEGGCGKTAIFKEFYNQNHQKIPICIFKATELNVYHINDLFRFEHNYSLEQFLKAYQNESIKVFVIDSAEKLAELTNNEVINNLIQTLKEAEWSVVFTTRYAYLNDLSFHLSENYKLSCEVIDIPLISFAELNLISKKFNFTLPENDKFLERLRNLFYLNEYVQYYSNIDKQGNFKNFIDLLWKKRIQNNLIQKDNLHVERERCIIYIARERCETGHFYIKSEGLFQPALFQLKQDEVLGYDDIHDGYFITHDIYEEWTLDKIVSRIYANYSDSNQFFIDLGNSLPIRRAFRIWLSDQLSDNSKEIESFIQGAFTNNAISQFWKDELLVSVLLSDYSETFFRFFENEIIADDFKIFKRIIFLLRIACTEISSFESIDIIKPRGKGWQDAIALIYKYMSDFLSNNLNLVLPLLTDWCKINKKGETTRYSGLLALSIFQKTETEKNFYIHDDAEEKILNVVFGSVNEIKSELKEIFDKVITNKWAKHNDPYEGLCSKIITKPYLALEVIKVLSGSVIQLCNLYWQKQERDNDDFDYERDSMESKYGLVDEYRHDYFPASAHQTPINWLLQYSFKETLDFIINFTNRAVENYRQSDYGKKDVEEIKLHVNEKEITQYLSWAIWGMYRGVSSPVVPYLLQSMHMALEKVLLEFAQKLSSEIIKAILVKILIESRSASLTSVVCSIVLANPDKLNDIALLLFETIELFHIDSVRSTNEFHAKTTYSIGYGLDKIKDVLYTDERIKTCDDKHRSSNLESLFLNYQFFGVKGFIEEQNAEFIKKLYKIIDQHKSSISTNPKSEEKSWGILLARMDRRNLTPKISKQDDNNLLIEFSPKELSDELREQSEQAQKLFEETFKYSALRTWSDFLIGRNTQDKIKRHEEYDNDPLLALSETKQLVEELKSGRNSIGKFDSSIPAFSCSKLLIEHKDKLSKEDIYFCKEIILSSVSQLFSDDYEYQISDGVEASFHAIPSLINEYPDETEDFISIMVLALLNDYPLGQYKRICDYVIESIHKAKLWEQKPDVAQSILFGYIKFKPLYKSIYAEKRKEKGYWGRIPKSSILNELDKTITDFTFTKVSFNINDISLFDIHDMEIIYQLIPSVTKDEIHLEIYKKSLSLLPSQLLKDRRSYRKENGDDSNLYLTRIHIFKRFAYFILQREIIEIDTYLNPFVDSFNSTEEASSFLDEILFAEDYLNKYEQFWYVWNRLYPKIKEISNNPRNYYLKNVIISYLLAWRWWNKGIEEWHSLKIDSLSLYVNVSKDLGHIPSVLYSITKVLNSIGSNFKTQGIDWIYTIISNNNSLQLDDLESNTLFYLEDFIRKFVFMNKQKIKEDIKLRNKIIPILDFMIERGSVHGYLLRESIL
jgi:hypothetical protein